MNDSQTTSDASTGELVTRLSHEVSELVRNELRLAQAEVTEKGRHLGVGAGLFGAAGVIALYGVGALIATAILALAQVLDAWLAALIVAVALLCVAGVASLLGKKQVKGATPPLPTAAVEGLKQDVRAATKGHDR